MRAPSILGAALAAVLLAAPARAAVLSYDATLGTLPDAQGWTFNQDGAAVPAPVVTAGVLQQGPTDVSGHQYWSFTALDFDFTAAPVTVEAHLQIVSASFHPFPRGGYNIALVDTAGHLAALHIASGAVFLGNDDLSGASALIAFDSTDAVHDYVLTIGPAGAALSIDGNAIVSQALGPAASSGPIVYFGDATILGNNQSLLSDITVTVQSTPEPASLALLGGMLATLAAFRRRMTGAPRPG